MARGAILRVALDTFQISNFRFINYLRVMQSSRPWHGDEQCQALRKEWCQEWGVEGDKLVINIQNNHNKVGNSNSQIVIGILQLIFWKL